VLFLPGHGARREALEGLGGLFLFDMAGGHNETRRLIVLQTKRVSSELGKTSVFGFNDLKIS
jgi:hypothetical protein